MTMRLLLHKLVAAAVLPVSCALITMFTAPPCSMAANPSVEVVHPADGSVVEWVFNDQKLFVEVSPRNPNKHPLCYNFVIETRLPPADWTYNTAGKVEFPKKAVVNLVFLEGFDATVYRIRASGNADCSNFNLGNAGDFEWTEWNYFDIEKRALTASDAEHFRKSQQKTIDPDLMDRENLVELPGGEPMTVRSGEGPGPGTTIVSPTAAMKAAGLTTVGDSSQVKVVKPAAGAVIKWALPYNKQSWIIEVAPKNPAESPACYTYHMEYRKPSTAWTFTSGMTREFPQISEQQFPSTFFGEDAVYRIKAAGNASCKNYNTTDEGDYDWTAWTHYTMQKVELVAAKAPVALEGEGGAPMTPRSGDAPPGGIGSALTPSAAAVKTGGLTPAASPPGSAPKVKIVTPTEGQTIFVMMDAPSSQYAVEVVPAVISNPPDCYIAWVSYKPSGKGSQWTWDGPSVVKPVGEQSFINPTITYHEDSEYRVEAAAWKCGTPAPNPRDLVADDYHAVKYVVKEKLGFKPQSQKTAVAQQGAPAFGGSAALSANMKKTPAGDPVTPRSGGGPQGGGTGAVVAPAALKRVKLPPGYLIVDEVVLLTSNPQPGHNVNVKVKVKNTGKGPTVKDEWKLEVKCYESPNSGACEQQLGAIPLAAIPKGVSRWEIFSGAVKVNSFGEYKLQANVSGGSGGYSGYLEFEVDPPKMKVEKQVPVDVPGPDPKVQKTAPPPRKIMPRSQSIQVR